MPKFYLSTPIYYINDVPHIGHAYTTIVADVLARYHRLKGAEVFFLTGTDENSQKNFEAARVADERDLKKYLDKMSAKWQSTWDLLGISNDDFIRTTEKRHLDAVKKFWLKVQKNGDIYQGTYEGFYCVGCEAFVTETDLVDSNCAIHKKPAKKIKEKNYFFRLTNYRDALIKHIADNPDFIQPIKRRNEIINYIKDFMTDVSISRQNFVCGIPVPNHRQQAIYVWFDALINYLTAIDYGAKTIKGKVLFKKLWPADLQLIGKDILKFHAALWPAMLMSADLPLPQTIFAHGYFTINGDKMSKSLGNVVDPVELAKIYSNDAIRWFLLSEIKFGEDGDFSLVRLKDGYNNKLANELGNLVHRVLSMTEKYCDNKVPKFSAAAEGLDPLCEIDIWRDFESAMDHFRFDEALGVIWKVVATANQLIDKEKPWDLAKNDNTRGRLNDLMYNLLETLRQLGWLLLPIMPETAEKIWTQLGLSIEKEKAKAMDKAKIWGGLRAEIKIIKGEPIFPKIV
ncbi:MAG: methionine--tRNA ligase [Candidatus Magasanikbacteria bacterium]|nr:methionine--tRNA ligase [Candidatus Magasanikbacteria bacterium]